MKDIKCVVFDFGGVIGFPHSEFYIKEMLTLTGVEREKFLKDYFYYRRDYDQGLTDTFTYWSQILKDTSFELTDNILEKLRIADASSWTQINPKTLDFIRELKAKGIYLVLLSNINVGALAYIKEKFEWLDLFNENLYSCDLKLLKPSPEIYEALVEKTGLAPKSHLFIDDSYENVLGAKAIGMESEQFIDFESFQELMTSKYNFLQLR